MSNFSHEQEKIIHLITNGHNVYVGGIGGCGKTFVANYILHTFKENKNCACVCTTGIAFTLYKEFCAQTIHSFSGIGQCRQSKEALLKNVLSNQDCVRRWKETEVLIVDEVSMLSQRTFEIIHYIAKMFGIQVLYLVGSRLLHLEISYNFLLCTIIWTEETMHFRVHYGRLFFPTKLYLNVTFEVGKMRNCEIL